MVLSFDRWVGKVAIVTGVSSGIGAVITEHLVEKGVIVAGLARRVERVEELAVKLAKKKGKLHPIKADISKEEDILNVFKWVETNLGHVHILINNAAGWTEGLLTDFETSEFRRVIDTNVLGLSIATREAVKIMKRNDINGHIIHINSVAGHKIVPFPGMNVYPATKYAVTALTETLRQELNSFGSKIKITSISPGGVDTEPARQFFEKSKVKPEDFVMLKCQDIADGVIYVLSTPEHVQVHELTIKPIGEQF